MRKYFLAALLCLYSTLSPAAEPPLTLGVFPYLSRVQLVEFHTPLKVYLETQLRRPVELVTAPDFQEFVSRTQKGEYDIILTAPHMGRLAETRDGYRRLAMSAHEIQGIFLARKDSPVRTISDLKGRSIVMAQPISIIYQLAMSRLREHDLIPGKNLKVIDTRTHNNALAAPLRGESDASLTSKALWSKADRESVGHLIVVGTTQTVPGHMLMAHPGINESLRQHIHRALLGFKHTEEGRAYFEATGQKDFMNIDDKTMKSLDPYTRILTEQPPPPSTP